MVKTTKQFICHLRKKPKLFTLIDIYHSKNSTDEETIRPNEARIRLEVALRSHQKEEGPGELGHAGRDLVDHNSVDIVDHRIADPERCTAARGDRTFARLKGEVPEEGLGFHEMKEVRRTGVVEAQDFRNCV